MRRLVYYAIYQSERLREPDEQPGNVFVVYRGQEQGLGYHGLYYSHRSKAWRYDPGSVARSFGDFMDDFEEDRAQVITREEAERYALAFTEGKSPLPAEADIWAMFQQHVPPPERDAYDEWDLQNYLQMLDNYKDVPKPPSDTA